MCARCTHIHIHILSSSSFYNYIYPTMPNLTVADVRTRLEASTDLSPVSSCEVADLSGSCGTSFSIRISASAFAGQSRLKQQRLVHKALGDYIPRIHALTIKCEVPTEAPKEESV